MQTAFLLMAQYNGQAVIPLDDVCRDYFRHLKPEEAVRQSIKGKFPLPIVRMDGSQKCAKGVHLTDLAAYLDERADAARKECKQLQSAGQNQH